MVYCCWDMVCDGCNRCFSFWAFVCLFTPLIAQKIKISENEKNTWRYHQFTYVYQKLWLDDIWFLRYGARQMDRQMDGQKKWHIEEGVPPKNTPKTFCIFSVILINASLVSRMMILEAKLTVIETFVFSSEICKVYHIEVSN